MGLEAVDNAAAVIQLPRYIPLELVENIVQFIPQMADYLQCTLVCRSWADLLLPKAYKRITLRAYRHRVNPREYNLPELLERVRELSSFMRNCVTMLRMNIHDYEGFTLATFTDIIDMFPNLDVVHYRSPRLPKYDPDLTSHTRTMSSGRSERSRNLSVLRVSGHMELEDADRPEHSTRIFSIAYRSPPIVFSHFLSIFAEIRMLEVARVNIKREGDDFPALSNIPRPRIHTLVNQDANETSMLALALIDRSCLLSIRDETPRHRFFDFVSHDGQLDKLEQIFAVFEASLWDNDSMRSINLQLYPSLVSVELQAMQFIPQLPRHTEAPWHALVETLKSAPPTVRDVQVTLRVVSLKGMAAPTPTSELVSLDEVFMPEIQSLDWDALCDLYDSKSASWGKLKIHFVLEAMRCFELSGEGTDRIRTIMDVGRVQEALRQRVPGLSSPGVSVNVVHADYKNIESLVLEHLL